MIERAQIAERLASLPEVQRRVVMLRRHDRMSTREIAATLDLPWTRVLREEESAMRKLKKRGT